MKQTITIKNICDSIKNRNVIEFFYKDHKRIVKPHIVGILNNGSTVLSAYRIGGYSKSNDSSPWRYFKIVEMSRLKITDENFDKTGNGL